MVINMNRLWLLTLLIWSSYGYTWSCSFNQTEDGWYLEDSMVCDGISVSVAIENHYCEWFRPDDPYCTQFQEPICIDTVEYRTLPCATNYSGGIQETRSYVCKQASWTNWVESSNNCTPNRHSCVASVDTRNLACGQGFDGQITETRISQCPDPYGEPVWLEWQQSESTCIQSVSDPISPIAPTNPVNPVQIDTVTVPVIDVPSTNPAEPTIESIVKEELSESSNTVETSASEKTDSTKDVKENKQDRNKKDSENNVDNVIDDKQDIVHGFGLSLSMDLYKQPMEFYQPQLVDPFNISQEWPIEHRLTEDIYLEFLEGGNSQTDLDRSTDSTWRRLRGSDIY